MQFKQNERVALFIDGANLYATARWLDFDLDYKRLLAMLRKSANLVRALYYTTVIEDQEFTSIRPLLDWLDYNGFTVITKPARAFTDGNGHRRFKGSMHIELTVDALRLAKHLDHVILCTGDGDFRSLVAALQHMGKRVSMLSTLVSNPPMIADELRRQADQFIELADLQPIIAREAGSAPKGTDRE